VRPIQVLAAVQSPGRGGGPRARREGLARRRRVRDGGLPDDVRGAVGEGR